MEKPKQEQSLQDFLGIFDRGYDDGFQYIEVMRQRNIAQVIANSEEFVAAFQNLLNMGSSMFPISSEVVRIYFVILEVLEREKIHLSEHASAELREFVFNYISRCLTDSPSFMRYLQVFEEEYDRALNSYEFDDPEEIVRPILVENREVFSLTALLALCEANGDFSDYLDIRFQNVLNFRLLRMGFTFTREQYSELLSFSMRYLNFLENRFKVKSLRQMFRFALRISPVVPL